MLYYKYTMNKEVYFLFSIGDNVVYPMQGIGVIERIEDKVFSGKNREYIIIKILSNNLEIMIPSDRVLNSHLRMISDDSTLENVLSNLADKTYIENNKSEDISSKERYQSNMNKIKSGSLQDSAEVVYDLVNMNKIKSLNTSEKQLLKTAHKFLVDEVSLIKNITENEAKDFLDLTIN